MEGLKDKPQNLWGHSELLNFVSIRKEKVNPQTSQKNYTCLELEHIDKGNGQLKGSVKSKSQKSIKSKFEQGDVLFGKLRPYLRKFLLPNFDGVCSTEIFVLVPREHISSKYLFQLVQTEKFINYANMSTGSRMPRSDWNFLKSCSFSLPPIDEQERIVAVLEVWDEYLKLTNKSIKLKEAIKIRLIDELVNCKTRLRGYTGPWQEKYMGELFDERNETKIIDLPLGSVTSKDGIIFQSQSGKKDTSNLDKSKYKRILPGDIGYNTMRMWQGRSALSDIEAIISPAYTVITPKNDTCPTYFSYLFKTPRLAYLFFQKSQGIVSDTWNCKFKDFAKVKYMIPSYEEQKAIAKLIDSAENEISLLKEKKRIIENQKKFLLNKLVTGEIRTPEDIKIPKKENSHG